VTVEGVRFEVPSHFRHLPRLTLRYASWDLGRLILMDPDSDALLARLLPQDKEKNASGRRRSLERPVATPPAAKSAGAGQEMPALLCQWLADYAATGLPPAYLPVPEVADAR
jgi:putative transposase